MTSWREFTEVAPRIAEIFVRRHAATGNLCMLGTLRPDGFPRISPMEPQFFDDELWIMGMPGTAKFRDLAADPRFTLHTATVDTQVADGDAKVWGLAEQVTDDDARQRLAEALYAKTGFDLRGEDFALFTAAQLLGAASVEVDQDHLDVTVWRHGEAERVIQKH